MKEEEEETFEGKSYIEKKYATCHITNGEVLKMRKRRFFFFARERVCCKRDGFYQGGL